MRVVLIGSAEARSALRARLPAELQVVGEAASMADARAAGHAADAWLLAPQRPQPSDEGAVVVESLTPRELEVLELLADGLPNRQIALRLGMSPETVKFHVAHISGKLGVSNRTEAVRVAIRRGLLSI
jgi:DNA-binding NarL/FixJ family response regulator